MPTELTPGSLWREHTGQVYEYVGLAVDPNVQQESLVLRQLGQDRLTLVGLSWFAQTVRWKESGKSSVQKSKRFSPYTPAKIPEMPAGYPSVGSGV